VKEYWEENLHALDRKALQKRLRQLAELFNSLPLPVTYTNDQLYFAVDRDFNRLIIGISKSPRAELKEDVRLLRAGAILIYYYDPLEESRKLEQRVPEATIKEEFKSPQKIKRQQIKWISGRKDLREDQWIALDERAMRILIKKGMIYINELIKQLGLEEK